MPATKLRITGNPAADELNATDPLALLIGMVLDQQVPLEWAFLGPFTLTQRLGTDLDVHKLAEMDEDTLVTIFCDRPALHRYPAAMARRVHELCNLVVDEYDGRPEAIWTTAADGKELYRRVKALPGFGELKARIFVALLAKQFGVRPAGWEEQAKEFGQPRTFLSVAANGAPVSLDDGATVVELLAQLGWAQRTVAVEHNGNALIRGEHASVVLHDGDVIEIVKAVAGG